MSADRYDPPQQLIGPLIPPSRERVAQWHGEDRCWNCGSFTHYAEGCPYPKASRGLSTSRRTRDAGETP